MSRSTAFFFFCLLLAETLAKVVDAADNPAWTAQQKRLLASLSLSALPEPLASPSNRVADSELAVEFGGRLFFDMRLGAARERSCATCHQPHNYFTDGADKDGFRTTLRTTPTVVGSAYNTWFYADGRRDTLWAQALLPIEAPDEMGSTRVATLRLIDSDPEYKEWYTQLFPDDMMTLSFARKVPGLATPFGDQEQQTAWNKLAAADKDNINRAFANVGKVLAAFQRTLNPEPNRVDRYIDSILAGNENGSDELSAAEIRGLALFIDVEKTQCLNCHNTPLLSNGGFHNIGTGNFEGERLDFGRVFGVPVVQMDPFNCLGNFSDAEPDDCHSLRFLSEDPHSATHGAFKVPALRSLTATAPYMHDGSLPTLRSVVEFYRVAGQKNGAANELNPLALSEEDVNSLVQFLLAL